ncbi:DgyrCDS4387 [Dimorphilus gyrociliatus]|uniref:DgyrCDS4387 n=1 Tax=Dimorphilus gyrociliatus TaxID=2664684 RepID=A0A7I8VHE7_9ANNE|nr:DgyrCDS4387 [Dimorphilus gyrociliatus]
MVIAIKKINIRKSINREDLDCTKDALEKACELCTTCKASSELLPHLPDFFDCLRYPVVAKCALYWIEIILGTESYFKFNTDQTPLHLALLDEISTNHCLLHSRIFDLLISIFERSFKELEDLVQLELKKTVVDRMIHLTTCDYVVPVLKYIVSKWKSKDTDLSLIRHFIAEFFDVIDLPLSKQIIENFKPLLKDEDLIGTIQRHAATKVLAEFMAETN